MTPRERTLALLGEAGAKLEVKLAAHDVAREIFDALPGEEKEFNTTTGQWWSKRGESGRLEWAVFTTEPPTS